MTAYPAPARFEVLHWPTPIATGAASINALVFDTCLRRLQVQLHEPGARKSTTECYRGREAYAFLLEVITGLRSQVPGETNVQGQFLSAWQNYCRRVDGQQRRALSAVIEPLLRDAGEIRRCHLQGIGGASYGSLLRKLLRPARGEQLLFVGDGKLTESLLPYFQRQQTACWNHREKPNSKSQFSRRFTVSSSDKAAAWADHVVMTTPTDAKNDQLWQTQLSKTSALSVTHLGRRRERPLQLASAAVCYDLDHLFELRARQANVRSLQIERARAACRDAASTADCWAFPALQRARA